MKPSRKESEWTHEQSRISTWSTVVNGCQMAWESPNGPWHEGYILSFWAKFVAGEAKWDFTIDRKAGGLTNIKTLNHLSLVTVNSSSVIALILGVVFHIVHDGTCPDNLKNAFKSLKVIVSWGVHRRDNQHEH